MPRIARSRCMRKPIHTKAHDRLLALLREARKAAGLTQWDVAERLGKPQSFVAKYDCGERRLDLIEFLVVARAIEADPVQLMEGLLPHLSQDTSQL